MNKINKIRVGILVDDEKVPGWVSEILLGIGSLEGIELCCVVINDAVPQPVSSSKFMYRLFRKMDRLLFSKDETLFRKTILPIPDYVKRIRVQPIQKKFTDRFPSEALQAIHMAKPDVLLRFGFRILKGEILSLAPYGILSLHHGDTDQYRGGPPAFWEVVNREPVSAVTLQQLTELLDGGVVLNKAFVTTDHLSFHRNQCSLYAASIILFIDEMKRMCTKSVDVYIKEKISQSTELPIYFSPLYKSPTNFHTFKLGIQYSRRLIDSILKKYFRKKKWILLYASTGEMDFGVNCYRMKELKPPKNTNTWADPFPVDTREGLFVFFEEKENDRTPGVISCMQFDENGNPLINTKKVVLSESFHLSYPFVFQYNEQWWMVPESASSGCVWLYRCVRFPDKWERVRPILEGVQAYDATLVEVDKKWFMFCTQLVHEGMSPHGYLMIYYTDDPVSGVWNPHPLNPIYNDVQKARPAGRLFYHKKVLYRPSQKCAPVYGYGINFFKVECITPDNYIETQVGSIKPFWGKKLNANHTFNRSKSYFFMDSQVFC